MNSKPSLWIKGRIADMARAAGAVAVGFARADEVDASVRACYEKWIAEGRHGSMAYLDRYADVRFDPRLLLPGARTVISMAFPYRPPGGYHHPHIADYALGRDYHTVIKARLAPLVRYIGETTGASSRVCVDTAPILERYWATRAGIGFIGLNRQLIVPGVGSGVFLGELVTTLEVEPDSPLASTCEPDEAPTCARCGRCIDACPGAALADGFDARMCRSYLSIEHRGELPAGASTLGACVYGCDVCQRVCPHNAAEPPEPLAEFYPDPRLLKLDRAALSNLSAGDWRRLTKDSAMRRITIHQLRRNLGI